MFEWLEKTFDGRSGAFQETFREMTVKSPSLMMMTIIIIIILIMIMILVMKLMMIMMMDDRNPLTNNSFTKKSSFPSDNGTGDDKFFLTPIFKSAQSFVLLRIYNF